MSIQLEGHLECVRQTHKDGRIKIIVSTLQISDLFFFLSSYHNIWSCCYYKMLPLESHGGCSLNKILLIKLSVIAQLILLTNQLDLFCLRNAFTIGHLVFSPKFEINLFSLHLKILINKMGLKNTKVETPQHILEMNSWTRGTWNHWRRKKLQSCNTVSYLATWLLLYRLSLVVLFLVSHFSCVFTASKLVFLLPYQQIWSPTCLMWAKILCYIALD